MASLSSSTATAASRSSNTATTLSSSATTTTLSSASSPADTNNNSSSSSTSGAKGGSSQIQVAVPVSVVIILVVLVVVVILVVICLRHRKRKGIENLHHELLNKSVDGHEYVTMDKDSKQTSPTAETTTSQRPSGGSPGGRPTSANRMEASYPRDERVQATYATVNKIRNSDAVSAAASSPGATNGTRSERGPADSTHEANEYSHLARHRKEGRMTENHYDG
ncbi:unnamed protein product [Lymnaea stagnalis]|uniref:Uncharacterized protein n=1 Tax=Lymnaea stagnalis TaxID=6523 RepID=A0AAV2IB53_LYMST